MLKSKNSIYHFHDIPKKNQFVYDSIMDRYQSKKLIEELSNRIVRNAIIECATKPIINAEIR